VSLGVQASEHKRTDVGVAVQQIVIDASADQIQCDVRARSQIYSDLAQALKFPDASFHEAMLAGEVAGLFEERIAKLPFDIENSAVLIAGLNTDQSDYDLFQSDYVGLFDVGAHGPVCPLYGGAWSGDRQRVMEESLRFYRFFGLSASGDAHELPDQICTQLEFLHFLTFGELQTLQAGDDVGSLRRASRDFLHRHPAKWLPKAEEKLGLIKAADPWLSLVALAAAVCEGDLAELTQTEGPVKG